MPIQGRLLDNAIRLLRPGGRLVLCTCSLQPEEGEHLLSKGLKRNAAVEIDPIRTEEMVGLETAIREDGSVRLTPALWPDRGGIDGFFIARLTKKADA